MPDPVKQLVGEHNRLRRLFKQVPRVGGHQSAETRALSICDLLTIHSLLEEEIVYPAVRDQDPAMAEEAEAAHRRAEAIVATIREADYADNGEVKQDLEQLAQEVEAHTRWEEDILLPRLNELPTEEVDRIGQALYERQQELLREYPNALEISAETEGYTAAPKF